ncbi:helix-turn-helix domain-containing protein [Billgrantia endophytica]|uniref:Transcriptional regulator n=1 Tax=Billgrantia endophytica TaxID=2033802 RepID=A0A2N7U119_9GAMM|nr:helix-turn-helix domain-containing protein [Halomonas endophytica]PMR74113.1 transcriptional regulator [Halomonas endophytica]
MNENETSKKPALQDWHRADIVAAVRKAGWTLRKLATHYGYKHATTLSVALDRRWPKGERIIAEAIGVDPATIWPSRYVSAAKDSSSKPQTSREGASRYASTGSVGNVAYHDIQQYEALRKAGSKGRRRLSGE